MVFIKSNYSIQCGTQTSNKERKLKHLRLFLRGEHSNELPERKLVSRFWKSFISNVSVESFIFLYYLPCLTSIMIIHYSGIGLRSWALNAPCISLVRAISTTPPVLRRRVAIHKHFSPILTVFNSEDMHIMEEGFKESTISLKSRDQPSSIDYSNLPLTGQTFTENSRRVGMVGVKIGMLPQWCNKRGERVLCTAIHFPSNEVISVVDPETWYKMNPIGKRKAYTRYGPMFKV